MSIESQPTTDEKQQLLVQENLKLKEKVVRLQNQAQALAQANAHAAELVAQLDSANENLQREIDRCHLTERQRQDMCRVPGIEAQTQLDHLQTINAQLLDEISLYKTEERQQMELVQQLEHANRELTEFAYVVSHDLKAPLRGIKTLASWITEDHGPQLSEQGQEQMRLLTGRIVRMEGLIEGILVYSRAGRSADRQESLDLNELVASVFDMIAPPEHITIKVEGDLPSIAGERTRVIQVFQNLISNAVKYNDKDQGEVCVRCTDDQDHWVFQVADNGMGIAERHFEKIFKVFQTLRSRDEMESSGVGLAVVRKIVRLYGGQIWLESKEGEGTTFYFTWSKAKPCDSEEKIVESADAI